MAEGEASPTRLAIGDVRVRAVVDFYERLSPASLAGLSTLYAETAHFVDPFNDVVGHAAIRRIFEHMFETTGAPRFEVGLTVTEGDDAFLVWDFRFSSGRPARETVVHGTSHLHFAPDGRIALHRDYWDPARELYEGVPVLGAAMRWLRRRLAADRPEKPARGRRSG